MSTDRLTAIASICLATTFAFSQTDTATTELYVAKCARCHGATGAATTGGKRLGTKDIFDPEVIKRSDAEWAEITAKGKNKMPAYVKTLSGDQINALVAYLRQLAKNRKK